MCSSRMVDKSMYYLLINQWYCSTTVFLVLFASFSDDFRLPWIHLSGTWVQCISCGQTSQRTVAASVLIAVTCCTVGLASGGCG